MPVCPNEQVRFFLKILIYFFRKRGLYMKVDNENEIDCLYKAIECLEKEIQVKNELIQSQNDTNNLLKEHNTKLKEMMNKIFNL